MKKFITAGILIGSTLSHSFWKFKGPFVTNPYLPNGYEIKETLTHAYNHPFLYDKHTNYFLTIGEANPKKILFYTKDNWTLLENKKDDQFEFLKGNFEYSIHFLNEYYIKYNHTKNRDYLARTRESGPYIGKVLLEKKNKHFLKEDILYLFDHMNRKMPWHWFTNPKTRSNVDMLLFSYDDDKYPIKFSEHIKINEKIQIINSSDKILLTDGKKYVDLQETLLDYYSGQKTFKKFATDLEVFYENISQKKDILFTTKEKSDSLFFPLSKLFLVNSKQIDLLQNSKILAVWGVLSDPTETLENLNTNFEPEKQDIIFGLAKDNNTGKPFHWITNLENNIKILLSLSPHPKTETKINNTIEEK